jgi:hypothetical protein
LSASGGNEGETQFQKANYFGTSSFPTLDEAGPLRRLSLEPDTVSCDGLPSLTRGRRQSWLFTLGPKGEATAGGTSHGDRPVPPLSAPEYLLRANYGHGPPGAKTPVHTHPGSEAFYVFVGRLGQRTAQGVMNVEAGHSIHPIPFPQGHEIGSGAWSLTG